jgi:predicted acylesterase/phospholipase RssA
MFKLHKLYFIFLVTIVSLISRVESKSKCYVLALEGGGDKGAYQAGSILGLVDNLKSGETEWDVVTGISVGSLNGIALASYELGKEKDAAEFLKSIWKNLKGNTDIYQNWWLGPLYGLLYKNSIYDTTPLRNLLDKIVSKSDIKRKFVIGTTNIKTGAYEKFSEETLERDEYTNAVLSSSAFPMIFPNIKFRDGIYMDGAVKIGVDIASGINKCLDMGFSEENIVVDALLCNSRKLSSFDNENYNTIDVLMRYLEITNYDNAMRDIEDVKIFFPKVKYRYLVMPSKSLPTGYVPLTFSPKQIDEMLNIGYSDAKNSIYYGKGYEFKMAVERYREDRKEKLGRKNIEK